jgi:hypothetical protein
MVVAVGLTVIEAVVAVVLHLYIVEPVAVSVALEPEHIVGDDEIEILGLAIMVTVFDTIATHPEVFVPVTV